MFLTRVAPIAEVFILGMILPAMTVAQEKQESPHWDEDAHCDFYRLGESCLRSGFDSEPTREEMETERQHRLKDLEAIAQKYPSSTTALSIILIKAMIETEREGLDRWDQSNKILEPVLREDGCAGGLWQRAYAHLIVGGNLYEKALNSTHPPDEKGVQDAIQYLLDHLDLFRWAERRLDSDYPVTHGWGQAMAAPWNANMTPSRFSGDVMCSVGCCLQYQAQRQENPQASGIFGSLVGQLFGWSPQAKTLFQQVIKEYPGTDADNQAKYNLQVLEENADRSIRWDTWAREQGVDPSTLSLDAKNVSRLTWFKETQPRKK